LFYAFLELTGGHFFKGSYVLFGAVFTLPVLCFCQSLFPGFLGRLKSRFLSFSHPVKKGIKGYHPGYTLHTLFVFHSAVRGNQRGEKGFSGAGMQAK
jgi:hypothetical protein